MKQYYILNSLGQFDNAKYCFTTCFPSGLDDKKVCLKFGGSLKGIYPANPFNVKMHLDEDSPKHIRKGSFVGNTDNYLIVDKQVVEECKKYNMGEVEFWPFTLINHKGRIHSQDYCFVCPVFPFDALNTEKSEIDRDSDGTVIGVDSIVLDKTKLEKAPDLFRVNDIVRFAFSEPLATTLLEKFTNFSFDKAEQV
jgi:hypothetical protein